MARESFISNATSTTSYPSNLSSFDQSALGLTDLPVQPQSQSRTRLLAAQYAAQTSSTPVSPSPWQRRRTRTPGPQQEIENEVSDPPPKPHQGAQSPSRSRQAPPAATYSTSQNAATVATNHTQAIRSSQSNSSLQSVAEGRVLDHRRSADTLDDQQQPIRRAVVRQRSSLSQSSVDVQTPPRSSSRSDNAYPSEGRATPTRMRKSSTEQTQGVRPRKSREQVREQNVNVPVRFIISHQAIEG